MAYNQAPSMSDRDRHLLATTKVMPSSSQEPALRSLSSARLNSAQDNIKDTITAEPVRANSVVLEHRPIVTPVMPHQDILERFALRNDAPEVSVAPYGACLDEDAENPVQGGWRNVSRLSLYALGVIYGDIGTSPLYTYSSIFPNNPPTRDDCIGALSLLLWALIMTVTLKYVVFILTADYHGEGGSFALYSLIRTCSVDFSQRQMRVFTILAFFGATMLLGDGVITPSISVLSAISGIAVYRSDLNNYVTLISIIILVIFFCCQGFGTSKIGSLFGPTMCVWFFSLAALGISNILQGDASVFVAFSPHYGINFLFSGGNGGFQVLAAVVLGVTGCEALYADMGHFGKFPIRFMWVTVVFPCLALNYIGQAARCAKDPSLVSSVYYSTIPPSLLWPMIILSTLATIIASQAVVSGSFSLVHQAIAMGFFPRVQIYHTDKDIPGQIYIPTVNYTLMIAVVAVTAAFKTSAALTIAYGVAVCVVMLISTYFFCCVAYYRWKKPIRQILPFLIIFGVIDVVFLAANLQKIEYGGWFPLTVSFILTMIMIFWNNGQELLSKALRDHCLSDEDVTTALKDALAVRVSGTGLFFTPDGGGIPAAITQLIRRLHILPERVVFVYIRAVDAPFVRPNEGLRTSLETQMKAKGVYKAIATFGYAQEHIEATIIAKDIITEIQRIEQTSVDVFREKKELPAFDIPLVKSKLATEGEIIYFTSRDSIASRKEYSGNPVRQFIHDLFVAAYTVLSRNAPDMATYYQIPENELIEIGTRYLV